MKAVFFFFFLEILQNPEILNLIYASGHQLGIKFDQNKTEGETRELVTEFEKVNAFIYSALKHKTRFCISDDPGCSKTVKYSYNDKLTPEGYYLCGHNADIHDLADIENPGEMIDFIKQRRYNVFMFDINDDYKKYLEWFAEASKTKFYINFSYMNDANINMIKIQTNR
jgi:hypothetical protein